MYIPRPVNPEIQADALTIIGKTMRENVQDIKITQSDEQEGRWSKIEFELLDDRDQEAKLVARRFLDALYAIQHITKHF